MAEQQSIKIPIEITPPQPQPAAERPAWARKSIHNVRMSRQEVQLEPVWQDNGPNVEIKWQPVEQSAQPHQQQESHMENQYGNDQPQANPALEHIRQLSAQPGPARPDLSVYDPYDPADMAEYNRLNDAYMQNIVDQRVNAALQPHMEALNTAKWERDYNSTLARYGADENFKDVMEVALQRVAAENGAISILQAYQEADNQANAKPGKRGNAHLPEQFRDKRRGIGSLGRIMEHNIQTGRSKPLGGRNWKG